MSKKSEAPAAVEGSTAPVATATAETAAPATTAAAAPVAEAKPPKPPKVEQNGVARPGADTSTGKVWAIADSLSAEKKSPAARADVIEKGLAAGLNAATIATQYGRWRKFQGLKGTDNPKVVAPAAVEPAVPAAA